MPPRIGFWCAADTALSVEDRNGKVDFAEFHALAKVLEGSRFTMEAAS